MYSTLGSSRLPVICVESRSRRSLALPLPLAWAVAAGLAPGLLGAAAAGDGLAAAGVADAGVVARGCTGADAGAEVLTPGSRSAPGWAGCCASAVAPDDSSATIDAARMASSLFTVNLLEARRAPLPRPAVFPPARRRPWRESCCGP